MRHAPRGRVGRSSPSQSASMPRMTTTQAPLGSGFGAASTADDVIAGIDLTGKTAIVTGGASGIGVPTVRALRSAGARWSCPPATSTPHAETLAGLDVEIRPMDLMVPKTIDVFAARFLASGRPLHLLVNNAGIGGAPLARDERGYESVFTTNHLGHFQLTCRLWPALRARERRPRRRRVVVGASGVTASCSTTSCSSAATTTRCCRTGSRRPRTSSSRSRSTSAGEATASARSRFIPARSSTATSSGTRRPRCSPRSGSSTRTATRSSIRRSRARPSSRAPRRRVWCATSPQLDGLGGLYAQDCDIAPLVEPSEALNIDVRLTPARGHDATRSTPTSPSSCGPRARGSRR